MYKIHTFRIVFHSRISEDVGPMFVITNGHWSCEEAVIREFNFQKEFAEEGESELLKAVENYCRERELYRANFSMIIHYCDNNGHVVGVELFNRGDVFDLLPIAMNTMTAFYR